MKVFKFLKDYGIFIAIVVGILFAIFKWHIPAIREKNRLVELLKDTTSHYELIIQKNGRLIASQNQRIASMDNALNAGLVREQELKEKNISLLQSIIRFQEEIKILKKEIELIKPEVITITETDTVCPPGTYLKVPTGFLYEDDWLYMDGTIPGTTIILDSLLVRSDYKVMMGWQKTGFFQKPQPKVFIENKNPYSTITGVQNIVIEEKLPFYKRPWWHRLEGAAGSLLFIKLINGKD